MIDGTASDQRGDSRLTRTVGKNGVIVERFGLTHRRKVVQSWVAMTNTAYMPKKRRRSAKVPIPTAKQLTDLKEKLGLTIQQMADEFNVPSSTFQAWMYGTATPPGPAAIVYRMLLARLS